jgi:hypothetical protein
MTSEQREQVIEEFCRRAGISRATYERLKREPLQEMRFGDEPRGASCWYDDLGE